MYVDNIRYVQLVIFKMDEMTTVCKNVKYFIIILLYKNPSRGFGDYY